MTIPMPDSIIPANMPPGYPAYLAYVDGRWATAGAVRAAHPGAHVLTLTVLGGSAVADGCDCENGDLTPGSAASWLYARLMAHVSRPVLYASRDTVPQVLTVLAGRGVARGEIRILSAHYGAGQHICGPNTCKASFSADGTQWTDAYAGLNGSWIDMSLLDDSFFGAPAPQPQVEVNVQLDVLRQGSSGQQVRNWQGLLVSHAYGYLIAPASGGDVMERAGVDGVFGPATETATRRFQEDRRLAADGIVGAQTWAAALG